MRVVKDNNGGNVFDKHFRELRNLETEPPADLWDKVEYKLDEQRGRVKYDHWYHAVILFLLPLTVLNFYISRELGSALSDIARKDTSSFNPILLGTLPSQLLPWRGNPIWDDIAYRSFTPAVTSGIPSFPASATDNHLTLTDFSAESALQMNESTEDNITPNQTVSLERLFMETASTREDVTEVTSRNLLSSGSTGMRGFHIGIEGGLNNSLILLRENTLTPLIGYNIQRKLDLSPYYGISMGYDFSRRFGIEAEWIIRSWQGMRYTENRYNKIHIDGEIDLEYMHFPVMFKYKWTRIGINSSEPRALNLVTGLQYSRLLNATVSVNNLDLENATEPFNSDELGLLLGLEYDIYMKSNYFLTLGARASISSDIRAFPYFKSDVSETCNVLIGVNAAFHYMVRRHKGK